MQDDAMIDAAAAQAVLPQLVEYRPTRRDFGFHFVDHIAREAKWSRASILSPNPPTRVHSTVNSALQRAVEATLQEALARYELNTSRYKFEGTRGEHFQCCPSDYGGPEGHGTGLARWLRRPDIRTRRTLETARIAALQVSAARCFRRQTDVDRIAAAATRILQDNRRFQ